MRSVGSVFACALVLLLRCAAGPARLCSIRWADDRLVSGQLGEGRVHLVGQRLVSVLVDSQLVCGGCTIQINISNTALFVFFCQKKTENKNQSRNTTKQMV